MEKIKIKLKECCLTCEHFDSSGIKGLVYPISCCGEPEHVIACGHMEVCKKYAEHTTQTRKWKTAYLPNFGMQTIYICPKCGLKCAEKHSRCPACGVELSSDEVEFYQNALIWTDEQLKQLESRIAAEYKKAADELQGKYNPRRGAG